MSRRTIHECMAFGDDDRDGFIVGQEEHASCASLFTAALAPGGDPDTLATGMLHQLLAELLILQDSVERGELSSEQWSTMLLGMVERVRVAIEVSGRISRIDTKRALDAKEQEIRERGDHA